MDAGISCHAHAACFLKFGQKCTHVICWRSFYVTGSVCDVFSCTKMQILMQMLILWPGWCTSTALSSSDSAERYSKPSGNGTSHVISSDKTVAKSKTRTKGGINRTMVFDHLSLRSGIILRTSAAPVVRWICIEMQFCKYPNIIIDRFSVFWLWKISVIFRWQ